MNELNYASLEASKRLTEAGIVIEKTDNVWIYARHVPLKGADRSWQLFDRRSLMAIEVTEQRPDCLIPAPSMAEVWRELPEYYNDGELYISKINDNMTNAGYLEGEVFQNANPTDALIDLLIWVRGQKGYQHTKVFNAINATTGINEEKP